jgi:hypothetical protein
MLIGHTIDERRAEAAANVALTGATPLSRQPQGLRSAWPIHFLKFLREADDRDVMKTEPLQFAASRAELAFAFEQHGTDDLRPDIGRHEGGFVEDELESTPDDVQHAEARQQLVANLQRQRPVQRFAPNETLAAVH